METQFVWGLESSSSEEYARINSEDDGERAFRFFFVNGLRKFGPASLTSLLVTFSREWFIDPLTPLYLELRLLPLHDQVFFL